MALPTAVNRIGIIRLSFVTRNAADAFAGVTRSLPLHHERRRNCVVARNARLAVIGVDKGHGDNALDGCLFGDGRCESQRRCNFHGVWEPTRNTILEFLATTTIADLAEGSGKELIDIALARPEELGGPA